jgi:hypothetical protein
MERRTTIEIAQSIMGDNFIGVNELDKISSILKIKSSNFIPEIKFSSEELKLKSENYILILGTKEMSDGTPLNILNLRKLFGTDPSQEPCFYNQDWYINEKFVKKTLQYDWYLMRKEIFLESRGVEPERLLINFNFPSAILVTYIFFVYWVLNNKILFETEYIWCEDLDDNGDRIYVGRYNDIKGISNSGFSIHRHLKISQIYGSV